MLWPSWKGWSSAWRRASCRSRNRSPPSSAASRSCARSRSAWPRSSSGSRCCSSPRPGSSCFARSRPTRSRRRGSRALPGGARAPGRARGVPPARALGAVAEVAAAAGEAGMVGGQALDLAAEGRRASLRRVQDIHRRKTGALLRSAVRVGALVAGADARTLRRLTAYGEHLGLAFQIADDILDAAGGPEADGRTDRALGKATYPGVLGLAGARVAAARERDAALAALRGLGRAAEPLRALAAYVVARAS